jgi:hypothetical protein
MAVIVIITVMALAGAHHRVPDAHAVKAFTQ